MDRPLLVGWSYGAALAVHWIPYGLTGEAGRERIRRLFRRMRWLFLLASRLGLAARMTQTSCAAIGPVLDRGTYPVRYILATGGNLGGGEEEMEQMRASLEPVLARNPNLKVSAKVASNHSHIVRKDFRAIAEAVREASVAARDHEVR